MRSKADILKDVRTALDMLQRAQYRCEATGETGPVSESYAIGWAKAALRRALDLPDEP
jgi:hypothetical protein